MKVFGIRVFTGILTGAIAWACFTEGGISHAQTQTVTLPPGVQDALKLSQAGIGEDVILTQIKNAGATYNLSADQLIYLSKSGVSQNVIKALIANNGASAPVAPVAPPAVTTTPPAIPTAQPGAPPGSEAVNFDTFHDELAPYGTWTQVPGYGMGWRPSMAAFDPTWRPYGNGGHWIYTDAGWSWESDYPWGGIAFHYGRWTRDGLGWVWLPGYDYAPAWVTWRHTDGYVGWAPLPPAAVFRAGVGLEFNGRVALDVDFGLGPDAFLFVGYDHFWDRDLRVHFLPHDRVIGIYGRTVIVNGYRYDHGRFFVEGLGRERIGIYTHHDVRIEVGHDARFVRHVDERRGRDDRRDHEHR